MFITLEALFHNRNQSDVERNTRNNQAGFRPQRDCVDEIFVIRQLIELHHELRQPLFHAFLDFSAVFDGVDCESIFTSLEAQGMQTKTLSLLKAMYCNIKSQILVNEILTEEFDIGCGVCQGCIGSPVLFMRCVDEIMFAALKQRSGGISIFSGEVLNDLDYADEIDLIDTDAATLQILIDNV